MAVEKPGKLRELFRRTLWTPCNIVTASIFATADIYTAPNFVVYVDMLIV